MMGGPSGSSGTGTGPTANVYTPQGQPTADFNWWQTLQPLINASANGGAGTPAGQYYPQAQQILDQYLTNSPYAAGALGAAQTASNYGTGTLFGQGAGDSTALNNASMAGLPYGQQLLYNGFNPEYGNVTNATVSNPYFGQALQGAQRGASLGGAGANSMFNSANAITQAGFDPQQALFNRTQGQLLDQSNVANSMAGVGNTPYGASVNANALGNFDLNWQNNLLNRETTAAGAASPLFTGAASLADRSAAMPGQTYLGQLQSDLAAVNAQNSAGALATGAYGNLISQTGSGFGTAQGLGTGAANTVQSLGAAPYNMGGLIGNNALSGIKSAVDIGNNQYSLPNDVMARLQSYMQLGQSASLDSGTLGQAGFNQLGQSLGGALSAGNMLFGGGGGGLLGGGGSSGGLLGSLGPSLGFGPNWAAGTGAGLGYGTNLLTGATSDVLGSGVAAAPLALSA